VDFISLLRETNRCPGGKNTIRKVLQLTHVSSSTKVLEIGSNTGFTSLEIARVAKCKTVGIDVVENAVAESQRVLSLDTKQIQDLVEFICRAMHFGQGTECLARIPWHEYLARIPGTNTWF